MSPEPRFISDAFRSRRDLSEQFSERLKNFVLPILSRTNGSKFNPLLGKFVAESLNVLSSDDASDVMVSALKYPSQYVRETAFRAARHLVPTPEALKNYVDAELLDCRYRLLIGSKLITRLNEFIFP